MDKTHHQWISSFYRANRQFNRSPVLYEPLEPRIMLAADLPVRQLSVLDNQTPHIQSSDEQISEVASQVEDPSQEAPPPTSSHVDALFGSESSANLSPDLTLADPIDDGSIDHLFAEVDQLLIEVPEELTELLSTTDQPPSGEIGRAHV